MVEPLQWDLMIPVSSPTSCPTAVPAHSALGAPATLLSWPLQAPSCLRAFAFLFPLPGHSSPRCPCGRLPALLQAFAPNAPSPWGLPQVPDLRLQQPVFLPLLNFPRTQMNSFCSVIMPPDCPLSACQLGQAFLQARVSVWLAHYCHLGTYGRAWLRAGPQ